MVYIFVRGEDDIGDLVRSRGLGEEYKRQAEKQVERRLDVANFYQGRQGIGLLDAGIVETHFHGLTQGCTA